jgi:hypothetical protein
MPSRAPGGCPPEVAGQTEAVWHMELQGVWSAVAEVARVLLADATVTHDGVEALVDRCLR